MSEQVYRPYVDLRSRLIRDYDKLQRVYLAIKPADDIRVSEVQLMRDLCQGKLDSDRDGSGVVYTVVSEASVFGNHLCYSNSFVGYCRRLHDVEDAYVLSQDTRTIPLYTNVSYELNSVETERLTDLRQFMCQFVATTLQRRPDESSVLTISPDDWIYLAAFKLVSKLVFDSYSKPFRKSGLPVCIVERGISFNLRWIIMTLDFLYSNVDAIDVSTFTVCDVELKQPGTNEFGLHRTRFLKLSGNLKQTGTECSIVFFPYWMPPGTEQHSPLIGSIQNVIRSVRRVIK